MLPPVRARTLVGAFRGFGWGLGGNALRARGRAMAERREKYCPRGGTCGVAHASYRSGTGVGVAHVVGASGEQRRRSTQCWGAAARPGRFRSAGRYAYAQAEPTRETLT